MLTLTGLLTVPPRSLYPSPDGYGRHANAQLVADDGSNWLLIDQSGQLPLAAGHRVAVSGFSDGHGLLVTGAALEPAVAANVVIGPGRIALTGRLEPIGGVAPAPRHRLTGSFGAVHVQAVHADLDGLVGNIVQVEGWLTHNQQLLAADVIRILPG